MSGMTCGAAEATNMPETDIEAANSVEICRVPTLLIIDEAQLVPASMLLSLRRILRNAAAPFGMVFCGIDMLAHAQRDQSLGSRSSFVITLRPLTGDRLTTSLTDAHPVLAAAPRDVLLDTDRVHCHGQWRAWMLLLEAHQNLHGPATGITRDSMCTALSIAYGVDLPAPRPARAGTAARRSR